MSSVTLDEIDQTLIAQLKINCRATNRWLADKSGINEQTVAARIRRLEEQKLLRIMAVVYPAAHGYFRRAYIGIQTGGVSPARVAQEISKIPNVIMLAVCFGRFELFGAIVARDDDHLHELVSGRLGAINGIEEVEVMLIARHIAFRTDNADLKHRSSALDFAGLGSNSTPTRIDGTDRAIIEELMEDGRTSFREVARRLKLSESIVRTRTHLLEKERLILFQAVTDTTAVEPTAARAYVALKIDPGQVDEVASALSELKSVGVIAITFGRFNIMLALTAQSRDELSGIIFDRISSMRGIRRLEIWEMVDLIKHDNRIMPVGV